MSYVDDVPALKSFWIILWG